MNMVDIILGAAAGFAGGYFVKEKLSGNSSETARMNNELNALSDENEKLRKRYKEAERQVEDLLAETQKLRRAAKSNEEKSDDREDELDRVRLQVKRLTKQNDELLRKIQEYQEMCSSYEMQLEQLKK